MGLTIFQVNIRNFKTNKYLLSVEITEHNPDIILLNEIGKMDPLNLKLRGYKGYGINTEICDGMAIFTKYGMSIEYMYFIQGDLLAIKVATSMGQIIVATSYSPPRRIGLPVISLNRLFSHQCPVVFIGDLNAHSSLLDNTTKAADVKGKQIENIINNFNLNVLGPPFQTFISGNKRGKPNAILANPQFYF